MKQKKDSAKKTTPKKKGDLNQLAASIVAQATKK